MEACYLRISCIIEEAQNEYVKSEGLVVKGWTRRLEGGAEG